MRQVSLEVVSTVNGAVAAWRGEDAARRLLHEMEDILHRRITFCWSGIARWLDED
jgi:hypothetical protein